MLDTQLIGEQFQPEADCHAVVVIVHGFGEHQGRYEPAALRLAGSGFAIFTFDLRGHGHRLSDRTRRQRFSDFTDDLAGLVGSISGRFPGKSIFLWGHSMGSVVLLDLALHRPQHVTGCITTGCPLKSIPKAVRALGGLGSALTGLVPAWSFNAGLKPRLLSHDTVVQADYANDPLVTAKMTLNLAFEFGRAIDTVVDEAARIRVPWLAIHGSEDEIAPVDGSRELIERLGSPDKTLEIIQGARHEVHNEVPEYRDQFFKLITSWINRRLASSAETPIPIPKPLEF